MHKNLHKQRHLWAALFTVFSMFGCWTAQAQTPVDVTITGVAGKKTENFDGLANTGTVSTPLPAGWSFAETGSGANANYTANNGAANTGETYSYGTTSATDRAFGGLQSGSVIPTVGGVYRNMTGAVVPDVTIAFVGEQWRLGATARPDRMVFQYSTDATSLTTGTWTAVTALDFTAPVTTGTVGALDGNLAANKTAITNTITGVNLANNSNIWIRWNDFNASGSDDGLAIDDFEITFGASTPPNIVISSPAQVTAGNVAQGTTNHVISAFQLAITTGAANLTGLTITTAGTYAAADLTNLKVRYSTDATLDGGDATLSTKTAALGTGTQVFPSFTAQSIPVGTGFIFVTADVAAGATIANNISVGAIAAADVSFTSFASRTSTVTAAGLQTIIAPPTATVALSSPAQVAAANVPQGTNNRVISAFQLGVTVANANLTGLTVTTAGSYAAADLNNLKVWYQNNGTFNAGTATLLSTKTTGLAAGTQVFTPFTAQNIPNATTGFIFVTADVAMTATVGATINVAAIANTALTFTAATVTGSAGVGGTQTVSPSVGPTIADVKLLANGTTVTVTGVISVAKQFGGTVFIQDATGGIAIFDNRVGNPLYSDANLLIGKTLTVTGTMAEFQPTTSPSLVVGSGLRQISPITSYTISAAPAVPPTPIILGGAMTEADEGKLVQINAASITDRGLFIPATSYRFNYGAITNAICRTASANVADLNIIGQKIPATSATMVGVISQFRGVYQFQPRMITDVASLAPHAVTYQAVPRTESLDVIAWNLEWFGFPPNGPANTTLQKDNAAAILASTQADVIILSEICNVALFNDLVAAMPGYAGKLSPCWSHKSSTPIDQGQKIGFIYRTSIITPDPAVNGGNVSCYLESFVPPVYPVAPTSFWSSGRFPAMLVVDATMNGVTSKLHLIGIHAKANGDRQDYDRRKADLEYLKQQLDIDFPTAKIIIGGDYNDDVDITVSSDPLNGASTYAPFVNDPARFKVNTVNLSNDNWRSYLTQLNVIDHLMTSNELYDYTLEGTATMPDVFSPLPTNNYGTTTSDHLPVYARYMITKPVIKVEDGATLIPNNTVNITDFGITNVGTPVTKTFTITNNGNFALNLSALTLPAGFSLVGLFPTSVAINGGTATFQVRLDALAAGTYNGNIQFTTNDVVANPFVFPIKGVVNVAGCAAITVNPATITGTATTGTAYVTVNYAATGGTAPYTFAVTAGALPTGMTLTGAGVLSGTPTVAGTYNFTVTATDGSANLCTGFRAYTIIVSCPTITLTPATGALATGTVGTAYTTVNFNAVGGSGAVNYTVFSGTLPTGLTLSGAGALTGTPTVAGTYNFAVSATDVNNCSVTQNYSIVVTCSGLTIGTQPTDASICTTTTGNASFTVAATALVGTLSYQWQENNGAGFNNIANGGVYSNATTTTLNLTGVGTSFNNRTYRCVVTNTIGLATCDLNSNTATLTILAPPAITSMTLAQNVCAGLNTTFTAAATGTGTLSYQWQEKVPAGAFTNIPNGGVYSGATLATLTLTGVTAGMTTNEYRVIITNTSGAVACPVTSAVATLTVNAAPVVAAIAGAANVCMGGTTTYTNATAAGVWSSATPTVATINATTGVITPVAAGTSVISYAVTALGCTTTVTKTITVDALPTITLGTINSVAPTATSFSLPFTATTGTPNEYSISAVAPNLMVGFANVVNLAFTTSPISVTIPASAVGTYNFNLTVRNTTTGCVSAVVPFTLTVAVQPNNALNFEGAANNYVAIAHEPAMKPTAAVTLEVWAFRNSWNTGMANTTIAGNTETGGYAIYTRAANEISAGVRRNGTTRFINTPSTGLATGWHHFAVTYDGRFMILYIDGVEAGRDDAGANFPVQYSVTNSFIIGAEAGAAATPSGEHFRGAVDEVRVWNVARTCSQLLSTKDRELVGNEAGLVAYYNFNQGIANGTNTGLTALPDIASTPTAHNGTLTAFALTGATSNYVAGATVTGTTPVAQPEINVQGNANTILTGTTAVAVANNTDFGSTPAGVAITKTFVIQNTDAGNLNVTGITFTGTNATEFSLLTPPTFPVVVTTATPLTITVQFVTNTVGIRNATINIANSDCDEAVYNFALRATTLQPTIVTSVATLAAFTACSGVASAEQMFEVSGTNLGGNLNVAASTGFEVSLTSGGTFTAAVSLTPTLLNAVASTPIFVRMRNNATNGASGNVLCTSILAANQPVTIPVSTVNTTSLTLGAVANILPTATSFSLPYTATVGSPNQYSIAAGTPNAMPLFVAVPNTALPVSPISVTVPASAAGTYNFNLTVRNTVTGCSSVVPFTVVVGTPPVVVTPPPPAPASQTITFDALPDRIFSTVPFTLVATASSGLPVSFTVVSGNLAVGGNTASMTGLGEVVVEATQSGNFAFLAATPVRRTFRILPAPQEIIGFDEILDRAWNSGNFFVNARSSSGLPVVYTITAGQNIASILPANPNLVVLNTTTPAVGRVTITATIPAGGNFAAATTLTRSFNVVKANQSIGNIVAPFNGVFGQLLTATVSASATSNLPVTTTVTGNATIVGNTLTINGAGVITLTFAQAGNDLWNAATNVVRTFEVAKANQTIRFTQPINPLLNTAINLGAVASSNLPVSIRIVSGTGTVNQAAGTVNMTAGGETVLELTQAGNDNFNAAVPVQVRFIAVPNIILTSLSAARFCGGANITINYTTDGTFPAGNIMAAYISDANGNFANAISLGNFPLTTSGSVQGTIPASVPSGTGYRVQIRGIIYGVVSNASPAIAIDRLPDNPFINYAANGDLQVVNPAAGLTFQWVQVNANGTTTNVGTGNTFKPTANGNYQVGATANGCTVFSNVLTFSLPVVTAAEDLTLSQATQVYPNPHEGEVMIKTTLAKAGLVKISVTDVVGKEVYQFTETATAGAYEHKLHLQHVAAGVYVISLSTDGKTATKKTVKQ